MDHGNGRPMSRSKAARLLICLTILAWATQLLLQQWGFGQAVSNDTPPLSADAASSAPAEACPPQPAVPDVMDTAANVTLAAVPVEPPEKFIESQEISPVLELRAEALIIGDEIRLKQVCRWRDEYRAAMAPLADLVVAHIPQGKVFTVITLDDVRKTLIGAGVNIAPLRFVGVGKCTISRSDLPSIDPDVLDQWTSQNHIPGTGDSKDAAVSHDGQSTDGVTDAVADASGPAPGARTLRQALLEDLSTRTGIAFDQLQVDFAPQDQHLLNLSEPLFHFRVDGTYTRQLGQINWGVEIASQKGSEHLTIAATARTWQNQLVVSHPLATHQIIRDEDLADRRVLVDHLGEDPPVSRTQSVGEQAAYEMHPGDVMTARTVEPVQMVKPGQLVTVTLNVGGISVRTAGRSMEAGCFGQCINVRNEDTHDTYQVTITGPQEGLMTPTADQTGAQTAAVPSEPPAGPVALSSDSSR